MKIKNHLAFGNISTYCLPGFILKRFILVFIFSMLVSCYIPLPPQPDFSQVGNGKIGNYFRNHPLFFEWPTYKSYALYSSSTLPDVLLDLDQIISADVEKYISSGNLKYLDDLGLSCKDINLTKHCRFESKVLFDNKGFRSDLKRKGEGVEVSVIINHKTYMIYYAFFQISLDEMEKMF